MVDLLREFCDDVPLAVAEETMPKPDIEVYVSSPPIPIIQMSREMWGINLREGKNGITFVFRRWVPVREFWQLVFGCCGLSQ